MTTNRDEIQVENYIHLSGEWGRFPIVQISRGVSDVLAISKRDFLFTPIMSIISSCSIAEKFAFTHLHSNKASALSLYSWVGVLKTICGLVQFKW